MTTRKKSPRIQPREFTPITDDERILELIHSFNGQKKHDDAIGVQYGLSGFQTSVLRQVFGKTEFVTKWHTPELKQAVVMAYEDGRPTADIAKENGLSVSSVYSILESEGVDRDRRDFWSSKFKIRQLIDLRENRHYSWAEIGKIMGRSMKCCHAKYNHMQKTKKIVQMHDVEHLSWDEISKVIGYSPKYCKEKYEKFTENGEY